MLLVVACSALVGLVALFVAGDVLGRLGFDLLTVWLSKEPTNQVVVVPMYGRTFAISALPPISSRLCQPL